LISARKQKPALRRGDFQRIFVDDRRHSYAFVRSLGDQKVVVALNASATQRHLRLPVGGIGWSDGRIVHDLLGEGEYLVSGEDLKVSLPPWGSAWIF
jgi:glycosidase